MRLARMFLAAFLALVVLVPASQIVHAAVPSPAPAVPALVLPRPVEKRLANGLRVVVFPANRAGLVQMQLLVPGGSVSEPDTLPGLAGLTAQLVTAGTTSRDGEQFAADARAIGATIATSAGRDQAFLACAVGAPHFEGALELMSDAAIGAVFSDDAFTKARHDAAGELGKLHQSAGAIADDRIWKAVLGAHPYAHATHGDIDAIIATNVERVRAFHREHWRPDRAVLAIAGDVTPDRAFAAAEEWFGRWAGRAIDDAPHTPEAPHAAQRLVDLQGAPYAEWRLAAPAPARGAAGHAAWLVYAKALESAPLPPGARVVLVPQRDVSLLVVSGAAPTDSAAAWLAAARRTVARLGAAPLPADAFGVARDAAVAAYPLALETLGGLITQWQLADLAGLGADALTATDAALRVADPAEVAAAAHTFAQTATALVAGDAAKLRKPLAALGRFEDLAIADTRSTAKVAGLAPATAEQRRAGRVAVNAALLAHGGAARLAAIRTTVSEGEMTLVAGSQEVLGQYSLVRVDPDRMSFATKMLQFENRQVLDGARAWSLTQADSASLADLDSTAVRTLRMTLLGDLIHVLRAAALPNSDVALRGKETIGGRACDQVDLTATDGVRWRLVIDRLTHRVVAIDGSPGEDGKWLDRRVFSDFRKVGLLTLPFIEERTVAGERVSVFRAKLFTVDKPAPPGLFKKPLVKYGQIFPQ